MTNPTAEWTKVLIHPLGLVGYALFLVFGLVARAKRRDEKRWLFPAALAVAGIGLVGALGLAYLQVDRNPNEAVTMPLPSAAPPGLQQQNDDIQQNSSQANSPNIQGVQGGSVSIIYSNSAKSRNKQATDQRPAPEKDQH